MSWVYDLRYATDHFPGIGTHAFALACELAAQEPSRALTMLWNPSAGNSRFDLDTLRRFPNVRLHATHVPALALGTVSGTGRELARLGAELFLSPFWLRPQGTRARCVLTLHDVIPLALPRDTSWARAWAYRWAMRRAAAADAVLTSSRFSRDEILRLTPIPARRLHVVPLGVAVPSAPMRRPARTPDAPFALCVGANRAHKGLDTLLAAWRSFAGAPPLQLLGAGTNAAGRFSLSAETGDVTGVRTLGPVAPEELEWLYRHATVVVFPTRYEGFGLPLLEAAARGTPVIASEIPALLETGDGVARFVAPGDVQGWANAVRELAADPVARERMRAAGLARAAVYTYAECARKVRAVLASVTGGSSA